MFIANKLKGKLAENGVSMAKLSEVLGLNSVTLYRKMTGKSDFNRKEIQEISAYLNLSQDDIMSIFFA